jgi:hypothetical protein
MIRLRPSIRGANSTVPCFRTFLNDAGHHRTAHFLIGHFASAIGQRHFGLVAVGQEFLDLADLDLEIMLVGAGTKLDLFDLRRLLVTPALVIFLAEFEFVLPIVHDAANRRLGGRSHLNKVVAPLLGLVKGLYGRQYS